MRQEKMLTVSGTDPQSANARRARGAVLTRVAHTAERSVETGLVRSGQVWSGPFRIEKRETGGTSRGSRGPVGLCGLLRGLCELCGWFQIRAPRRARRALGAGIGKKP